MYYEVNFEEDEGFDNISYEKVALDFSPEKAAYLFATKVFRDTNDPLIVCQRILIKDTETNQFYAVYASVDFIASVSVSVATLVEN